MELSTEQIQVLLIEKMAGSIDEKDNLLIEQLLANDMAVRKLWMDLQQQLSQIGGLPGDISEQNAWQKLSPLLKTPAPGTRMIKVLAVAAALATLVAGAFLLRSKPARKGEEAAQLAVTLAMDNGRRLALQSAQTIQVGNIRFQADQKQMTLPAAKGTTSLWSTLEVPATMDFKMVLSDGSEVWLNSQTRLRFPLAFPGTKREVYVQGEAYFKISKDPSHPFIVHTDRTDVLVVGTQFNVNTYEVDSVETALVDGAVITRCAKGSEVAIRPGLKAVYSEKHGFTTRPFDAAETLSWMKGVYYFHNASLGSLSKILARWYNVEVYFTNNNLQNKTFSGELSKGEKLQVFLDNLNLSEDLHAQLKGGKVFF